MVTRITATATDIQVVIQNQGDLAAPVNSEFWVDVYINPSPAPTAVNQTWRLLGTQGLVWGVTADALPALTPGVMLTLTTNGPYFCPSESQINWPLPAGTVIYVQVDPANVNTTYGAVREAHEILGGPYNTILGPVRSTGANDAGAAPPRGLAGPKTLPQAPGLWEGESILGTSR